MTLLGRVRRLEGPIVDADEDEIRRMSDAELEQRANMLHQKPCVRRWLTRLFGHVPAPDALLGPRLRTMRKALKREPRE